MRKWGVILGLLLAVTASGAKANFLIIQQTIYRQDLQFFSSSPTPNQALNSPPQTIAINFTAPADPVQSSIDVYDPYGNRLTTGPLRTNGNSVSVAMPQLGGDSVGVYHVQWKAVCQCTESKTVTGNFYFHIQ